MNEIQVVRRVLAVGPALGAVTGQSVAFSTFVRGSRHRLSVVNTNAEARSSPYRAWCTIRAVLKVVGELLFREHDCLYITTSRSRLGAIKDVAIINIAKLFKIPVVNHLHGSSFTVFRESLGLPYRTILDWTYNKIDVSIVLHTKLAGQYRPYSSMQVRVVNNFVGSDVAALSSNRKSAVGAINVLFLSNVIPEKGVFELTSAIKTVVAGRPDTFRLRIAGKVFPGTGCSAAAVRAKLDTEIHGVREIEYCGFAGPDLKRQLLEWAHVLALPSYMREEAVPLCVLEGMAAGCFVVVSDFGVLPDVISAAIGAVVPARSTAELEKLLRSLIGNRQALMDASATNPGIATRDYSEGQYISGIDAILATCRATKQ